MESCQYNCKTSRQKSDFQWSGMLKNWGPKFTQMLPNLQLKMDLIRWSGLGNRAAALFILLHHMDPRNLKTEKVMISQQMKSMKFYESFSFWLIFIISNVTLMSINRLENSPLENPNAPQSCSWALWINILLSITLLVIIRTGYKINLWVLLHFCGPYLDRYIFNPYILTCCNGPQGVRYFLATVWPCSFCALHNCYEPEHIHCHWYVSSVFVEIAF